jgi:hypothetical protein
MPELKDKLDKQEKPAQLFRPDESDRAARVKAWMRQARGLPPQDEGEGR